MIVREIIAKSILSKSQVYDYVVNPYVGCSHACRYCYAAEDYFLIQKAEELQAGFKRERIPVQVLFQQIHTPDASR